MTAAPPDPRGVAGLVGEWRRLADEHAIVAHGANAVATNRNRAQAAVFRVCADALEAALAASPVSQPTVGGEAVAWEWRLRKSHGEGWTEWERITHDQFLRVQLQSPDIETRVLYATPPASVEPVSQDAERLEWLAGESRKLVGPRKYRAVLTFRMGDHHETLAQALREGIDMGRAAARQEKGR